MSKFDNVGLVIDNLAKFETGLAKAVDAGLLTSEQMGLLRETGTRYYSENRVLHLNSVFRKTIADHPDQFEDLNYKEFLELDPTHTPRLVMLALGVGIVVGFVWAMSD